MQNTNIHLYAAITINQLEQLLETGSLHIKNEFSRNPNIVFDEESDKVVRISIKIDEKFLVETEQQTDIDIGDCIGSIVGIHIRQTLEVFEIIEELTEKFKSSTLSGIDFVSYKAVCAQFDYDNILFNSLGRSIGKSSSMTRKEIDSKKFFIIQMD